MICQRRVIFKRGDGTHPLAGKAVRGSFTLGLFNYAVTNSRSKLKTGCFSNTPAKNHLSTNQRFVERWLSQQRALNRRHHYLQVKLLSCTADFLFFVSVKNSLYKESNSMKSNSNACCRNGNYPSGFNFGSAEAVLY